MFYIILLVAILLPLLMKEKQIALKISFCCLFVLWGLQYDMVMDWRGNMARWYDVTSVISDTIMVGQRTYEPVFVFLIKLSKPIGFFGWLIACGIFDLTIFYILIKKYVPEKYYWVTIFALMTRTDLGLLLINSNRQTLSVVFSMIGVLVLLYQNDKELLKNKLQLIIKSIIFITLVYIASNIHSAAKIAYLLLPLYLLSHYVKRIPIIIILIINIVFFARFFADVTSLQDWATEFLGDISIQDTFSSYMTLIDNSRVSLSVVEHSIFFIIMNGALFYYKHMNKAIKLFALCTIIAILGKGFLIGNLSRLLQYFYIYIIVLVPYLVIYCLQSKEKIIVNIRKPLLILMCLYCIYAINRELTHEHYHKWKNFKTILSAPEWK